MTRAPSATPAAPILPLDRFKTLLRTQPKVLTAFFADVGASTTIDTTHATVHCRYLTLGGNNLPRVKDLADYLAQEVINYAIPRTQLDTARRELNETGSARGLSRLHRKATSLFTDIKNTGEGGELLLYLMTEAYIGIPQLFCKMPLKTNPNVHFHGADGIHGTCEPTGELALYWGESKLYNTLTAAVDKCFESLAQFVVQSGGSGAPQRRDLELLSDLIDLNDPLLEAAILRYLDPADPQFNKLVYRGIALVGFDSDAYAATGKPLSDAAIKATLEGAVASWHKSVGHHIAKHKLADIAIEVFCIPFPSVEEFRQAFLEELGLA